MIRALGSVLNVGEIIKIATRRIIQPDITQIETEIYMFILENIVECVKTDEKESVEELLRILFTCPTQFHKQSIRIICNLSQWFSRNSEHLLTILNFLGEGLCMPQPISNAAAEAIKEISKQCQPVMKPHLPQLFTIVEYFELFNLSENGEMDIIKGISAVIEWLPPDELEVAMKKLVKIILSRIYQFRHFGPLKIVEQLVEIFERIYPETREGRRTAANIFEEFFPSIKGMFKFFADNKKVVKKLFEIIQNAIANYKYLMLPEAFEIMNIILDADFKSHYNSIFDLGRKLLEAFGEKWPNVTSTIFSVIQLQLVAFWGEEDDVDAIDGFFKMAIEFVKKNPSQFLQEQYSFISIMLAIRLLVLDVKEASVLKFIYTLITVEGNENLKACQRQFMSTYGDEIIFRLLYSVIHKYDISRVSIAVDILNAFKSTSPEGFKISFENACINCPIHSMPFGQQDAFEKLKMLSDQLTG